MFEANKRHNICNILATCYISCRTFNRAILTLTWFAVPLSCVQSGRRRCRTTRRPPRGLRGTCPRSASVSPSPPSPSSPSASRTRPCRRCTGCCSRGVDRTLKILDHLSNCRESNYPVSNFPVRSYPFCIFTMYVPRKDIGAEDASDDVAEVGDIIDVGEGRCHQDIAGAVSRTSWPLKSESFFCTI